ncbi:Os04g0139201 [Oryza sativa Japonica Group]|uniref:Os04g0139201 protein n=1 Tax=Oryza sativa subsp. japonica TaxID=39947 RepID=A0A0P0W6Q1_ORYSJ|nr:Os04g0139201 [Oryza sativa Japonica Group]
MLPCGLTILTTKFCKFGNSIISRERHIIIIIRIWFFVRPITIPSFDPEFSPHNITNHVLHVIRSLWIWWWVWWPNRFGLWRNMIILALTSIGRISSRNIIVGIRDMWGNLRTSGGSRYRGIKCSKVVRITSISHWINSLYRHNCAGLTGPGPGLTGVMLHGRTSLRAGLTGGIIPGRTGHLAGRTDGIIPGLTGRLAGLTDGCVAV